MSYPQSIFASATVDGQPAKGIDEVVMKLVLAIAIWGLLFVVCWPFAVMALLLLPLLWVISIPIRLIGMVVNAGLALVRALLFLPARILGSAGSRTA